MGIRLAFWGGVQSLWGLWRDKRLTAVFLMPSTMPDPWWVFRKLFVEWKNDGRNVNFQSRLDYVFAKTDPSASRALHIFSILCCPGDCPQPFKAMDLNLWWVMNSSENLKRAAEPLLKKCTNSDTWFCGSCSVVSTCPEPHPLFQLNNPSLALLHPHRVACSFTKFP